jgi:hypothetical protein
MILSFESTHIPRGAASSELCLPGKKTSSHCDCVESRIHLLYKPQSEASHTRHTPGVSSICCVRLNSRNWTIICSLLLLQWVCLHIPSHLTVVPSTHSLGHTRRPTPCTINERIRLVHLVLHLAKMLQVISSTDTKY